MGIFTKQTEAEKQAAREAVETRRRARQLARGGNTGDIHVRSVSGLRVYAARLSAAGDPKGAASIEKQADTAAAMLAEVDALRAQIATPRPDFVGDAVKAAAAELCKRLPCCYPTLDDGLAAASRLPLIEARRAESLACDKNAKLCRQAAEKNRAARFAIEQAALVCFGGVDDMKAVRDVAALA
jgi:hypothetical protein